MSKTSIRYTIIPLIILLITSVVDASDKTGFPEINGNFPSRSMNCDISNLEINYKNHLRVVFQEGTLYRRCDSISYDLFYSGTGFVEILDTTGINGRFKTRHEFGSGYLCGKELSRFLNLSDSDWSNGKIDRRNWQKLQFMLKTADKYFGIDLSAELAMWSDNETLSSPIWLDFEVEKFRHLVIYITPDIPEQLSVYMLDKKYDTPQIVTGFGLGEAVTTAPAEIDSSQISIKLRDIGRFDASCKLFLPLDMKRNGIKLILPHNYKVDSVVDNAGQQLPYIKKNLRANLYFRFKETVAHDSSVKSPETVTVYYTGKFLRPSFVHVDMPINMTTWFPRLPYRNLGGFTIDYTLHKELELISVGQRIGESIDGDQKTVTYKTDENISYISFASGIYDKHVDTACGFPITLFVRKNNQGLFGRRVPRNVLADISGAYDAFCQWFGNPQTSSLNIVDQPIASYQSSPGLIHLSENSLYSLRDQPHILAHEVAHQWWGHTAIPASYRDMWLSEGLAEISAAMYILRVKKDSAAFREKVNDWRRHVVEEGKIGGYYSRGYKAGPIMQGIRLMQSSSIADYVALVYSKAAYMMLMLRFEMDGPDYKTDFFSIMLGDYCRRYSGKHASSVDFMQVVKRYIGADRAQQFFIQWLYGWKIPRFICYYRVDYDEKSRSIVTTQVDIEGVDKDFASPYPVEIEFSDKSKQMFRVEAASTGPEFKLGPFPLEVKKIRFNPHYTILSLSQEVVEM